MKKKVFLPLTSILALSSCQSYSRIPVKVDQKIDKLLLLTSLELQERLEAKASLALLVFVAGCQSCIATEGYIDSYIADTHRLLYKIEKAEFERLSGLYLNCQIKAVPTIIFILEGQLKDQKTQRLNEESYIRDLLDKKLIAVS